MDEDFRRPGMFTSVSQMLRFYGKIIVLGVFSWLILIGVVTSVWSIL